MTALPPLSASPSITPAARRRALAHGPDGAPAPAAGLDLLGEIACACAAEWSVAQAEHYGMRGASSASCRPSSSNTRSIGARISIVVTTRATGPRGQAGRRHLRIGAELLATPRRTRRNRSASPCRQDRTSPRCGSTTQARGVVMIRLARGSRLQSTNWSGSTRRVLSAPPDVPFEGLVTGGVALRVANRMVPKKRVSNWLVRSDWITASSSSVPAFSTASARPAPRCSSEA